MSEKHTPQADHEIAHQKQLLTDAELAAMAMGFDLHIALQNNYGPDKSESDIAERADSVRQGAAEIAAELKLDDTFFERPANTILLFAVAAAWKNNEEKTQQSAEHDPKIAGERAMLVDVMLMTAGERSGVVRELVAANPDEAKRYVAGIGEEEDKERAEYIKSFEDPELSSQVKEVLFLDSENGILAEQRLILGVTAHTEQAFDVKVLKMGKKWELHNAGLFSKVEWPSYVGADAGPEERQAQLDASARVHEQINNNAAVVAEYEAAAEQYAAKYGEKHGPLAPAFVDHDSVTGKITMYLQAPDAIALIQHARGSFPGELDADMERRALATVRHEFAHTQKNLTVGAYNQLGMVLEERKAEYVSHDKLGYQDIKYFVADLAAQHDTNIIEGLDEALKESDALSAFLSRSAKNVGLRNTLLLMASKPSPYDKDPHRAAQFADMNYLKRDHAESAHDAVLRKNFEAKGRELFNEVAARWAATIVTQHGVEAANYVKNSYISDRESHGLELTADYLRTAVDVALEEHTTK